MSASRAFGVALAFAAPLLAGCLTNAGGASSFARIDAPVWQSGNAWTYDVSTSWSGVNGRGMSTDGGSRPVTLTVFNTSEPLRGVPAYYVKADHPGESMLWPSTVMAFSKATLELLGAGSKGPMVPAAPPPRAPPGRTVVVDEEMMPLMHWPVGSDTDVCAGRSVIDLVSAGSGDAMPGLHFPLVDGQVQTGRFGNGQVSLSYERRTHGLTTVTVPAGSFQAAVVTVDAELAGAVYGAAGLLKLHAEYDYSPDLGYLARAVVAATASSPVGPVHYESVASLTGFNHGTAAPTPAPYPRPPPTSAWRPLQIVSDVPLPANVAGGPTTVRFWLEDPTAPAQGYDPARPDATRAPFADPTYRVTWTLRGPDGWHASSAGMYQFAYTFTQPGRYQVTANVGPARCGDSGLGSFQLAPTFYWERTWNVAVDPGVPQPITLDHLTLQSFPVTGRFNWTVHGSLLVPIDQGHAALVDASGRAVPATSDSATGATSRVVTPMPGAYTVEWIPEGHSTLGPEPAPVVVGDDATVTLHLDYGYGFALH